MQFAHFDLGFQRAGDIVEVTLSRSANVRLLDAPNFVGYRRRRRHIYYGGRAIANPVTLIIPNNDHWHVAVDMRGLRGTVTASVKVLPQASQVTRSDAKPPQDPPPGISPTDEESTDHFDVFISHASEDKDELVRPLATALMTQGLRVWYDEFELRIGDSLRRKIDQGLAMSRYGVVVLSPAFFAKNWTQYELDGLVAREVTGERVILPVWHKLTKEQVIEQSPTLTDRVAGNTGVSTIEEIALEIASIVREGALDREGALRLRP